MKYSNNLRFLRNPSNFVIKKKKLNLYLITLVILLTKALNYKNIIPVFNGLILFFKFCHAFKNDVAWYFSFIFCCFEVPLLVTTSHCNTYKKSQKSKSLFDFEIRNQFFCVLLFYPVSIQYGVFRGINFILC